MIIQRSRWKGGPSLPERGPYLVSVTDFRAHSLVDLPRIVTSGMRLRRAWPSMEGAVGMWLWIEILGRRSGSVSVWRSEEDLHRFVRWDEHLTIVKAFRDRGTIAAKSWWVDAVNRREIWSQARTILEAGHHARAELAPPATSHPR